MFPTRPPGSMGPSSAGKHSICGRTASSCLSRRLGRGRLGRCTMFPRWRKYGPANPLAPPDGLAGSCGAVSSSAGFRLSPIRGRSMARALLPAARRWHREKPIRSGAGRFHAPGRRGGRGDRPRAWLARGRSGGGQRRDGVPGPDAGPVAAALRDARTSRSARRSQPVRLQTPGRDGPVQARAAVRVPGPRREAIRPAAG